MSASANPSSAQVLATLVLQLEEEAAEALRLDFRKLDGVGGEVGVLDVGDRFAERAEPGGDRGMITCVDPQVGGEPAGVRGGRAAAGDEC